MVSFSDGASYNDRSTTIQGSGEDASMTEQFHRPATVREAVGLKKRHQARAAYLAGGTWLNSTESGGPPPHVISLAGLGLDRVVVTPGRVEIGALCRLQRLAEDRRVPAPLKAALGQVVSRNLREIATLGGHVGARYSHSDVLPMLLALEVVLEVAGPGRSRRMCLEEYLGTKAPGLITKVLVPKPKPGRLAACRAFRVSGNARSLVSAAVAVTVERGLLKRPRVALGGVARTAVRLVRLEQALDGQAAAAARRAAGAGLAGGAPGRFVRGQRRVPPLRGGRHRGADLPRRAGGEGGRRDEDLGRVNGAPRTFEVRPDERVRSLLRRENILSVRNGCDGQGSCGACTILLDGRPVNSCLLLAPQVDGREIHTVEHMSPGAHALGHPDGLPRRRRGAVRLLHAALPAGHRGAAEAPPAPDPRAGAGRLLEPVLPLHRLRADVRRRRAGGGAAARPGRTRRRRARSSATTCDWWASRRARWTARGCCGPEKAYVEDMVVPGTCHLKLLGSPHAHAYIRRIARAGPRRCRAWCW